ncbi:MAG: hypothetical protein AB7T14_07830, partial [Candidatus Methylacidiphilaceae bacterium]
MQVNPFWPAFLVDPRKTEPAWRPLFSEALRRVSTEFERRFPKPAGSWPPGREWRKQEPILLVGSNSSGGGTTTLIGTLFQLMEGKALPIYVRPFRNPRAPWKSLLEVFREELVLPDRPRALRPWPEEPSRIQVFANDILGSLAFRLVNQGRIRDTRLRSAVRFLRRHPSKVLLEGLVPEWAQWLRQDFARVVPAAEELLAELGRWGEPLHNWLWAVHGLAVRTEDRIVQRACRHWIFGEPVDWTEAIRANLAVPPQTQAAGPHEDDEGLCRRRVEDLIRLSSLSKPFLLAFDNADAWGAEPALAASAAHLLEILNEGPPAFLLLGAYFPHWNASVLPHWSDKQRSLLSTPLALREIERPEAMSLLEERLARFERRRAELRPEWLESIYGRQTSLPPRELLLSHAIRWDQEHSARQGPSSIRIRWLLDAKLQWEMFLPNLPFRWVIEWALLPLEPPADSPWQRQEIPPWNLFCARSTLPERNSFLFLQSQIREIGDGALLPLLEGAVDRTKAAGRTLEAFGLVFEGEESASPANRTLPEKGSPGLTLLQIPSEEMLDLSAAVSLSFSFRRGRAFPWIEETTHDQAEEILAGWRVRLPIPGPALPIRRRPEELSLPMIESVRDAIRAKR